MSDIIIAYIDSRGIFSSDDIECWNTVFKKNMPNVTYIGFPDLQSLFHRLSSGNFHVDYVALDIEFLQSDQAADPYALISAIRTLSNAIHKSRNKTKIIGVVSSNSSASVIKEFMPIVDSLCMRYSKGWSLEIILENQKRLLSGDTRIPKEIQKLLNKPRKIKKKDTSSLTPRQQQVFTLIVRNGASNKIIARTLNISESTVKLHISSLLRKYCLKNRTQLVVFAKDAKSHAEV